ncbi:H-type small acid-soluble spore protein [Virgibacillus sp. YIM 98842]|jgi:small acid-soluble spore protein H (minor)|uniref:H-type small acid-soluble spore protein n=1 Tax=Virgibacillus sp. YIM 98842 TaxID=2663533 RepID=UPI0013DA3470|nr:H-type small acid-soluble spore protein [Virgibacillus sp. YIM 98842]
MEKQRAQEIVDAIEMIQVSYRGIPVYIQEVHAEKDMATVFPLDQMDDEQTVELNGLYEVNPNEYPN